MKKNSRPHSLPLLVIVGPTASGKSALAVKIARRLATESGKKIAAEIISADSRQVYKGLNIGTGKITLRGKQGVPHHLLDAADPRIPVNSPRHFSVEKWRDAAAAAIADIHARGRLPIVCGGTGFYISALVDGMSFPDVPPNPRLRGKLSKKTTGELFGKLKKLDPRRARDMRTNGDFQNTRRLIRAIEIAAALGKVPPMPALPGKSRFSKNSQKQKYVPVFIGISLPPEQLKKRIGKRLHDRLKKGMINEVQNLHAHVPGFAGKGLSWKRMRELGLEYRHIAGYLQSEKSAAVDSAGRGTSVKSLKKEEMIKNLSTAIWHYSKRQMTWWKRDRRIVWLGPEKAFRYAIRYAATCVAGDLVMRKLEFRNHEPMI